MTADALRTDAERFSLRRRAWMLGGSLLLAATIMDVAILPVLFTVPGAGYVSSTLHAAALFIFAFGLRGQGSVTDRRPLGTTALVILAAWSFISPVLVAVVPVDPSNTEPMFVYGTVSSLAQAAIALVAVVQIGRAGVVPSPWSWAPAWAYGALAGSSAVQYLGFAAGVSTQQAMSLILGLDLVIRVGTAVFLGVLAIILANRPLPTRTVPIIDTQRQ